MKLFMNRVFDMSTIDFTVLKSQLDVAEQKLRDHRRQAGSVVEVDDEIRALHDAVQALHVGLASLAEQLQQVSLPVDNRSIAQQIRDQLA